MWRTHIIYNSDQSGFRPELLSGRALATKGEKKIERAVQSVPSTTHSYTVQPIVSAGGKILSPLLLVLKEPKQTPIVTSEPASTLERLHCALHELASLFNILSLVSPAMSMLRFAQ